MKWDVEFTDEFGEWWDGLTADEQSSVRAYVNMLRDDGPGLRHPYCSGINDSKYSHMRELRVQHAGRPYRVFYAFDPRRIAILLIGGDKTGDDRFYDKYIPMADKIYEKHLKEIFKEG